MSIRLLELAGSLVGACWSKGSPEVMARASYVGMLPRGLTLFLVLELPGVAEQIRDRFMATLVGHD